MLLRICLVSSAENELDFSTASLANAGEMAQAFVNAYRETGWRAVYSSSLRRSITTAQPLCHALGLDLRVRAELNEIAYGKWEGLTKEKVNQEYHDDYVSWLADSSLVPPNVSLTDRTRYSPDSQTT